MAKLISGEKIQALKMIAQAGRKTDLKKTIRQRGAVGLADDGNVIKGTFLATSKETPSHEEGFFYIALEDDSENVRTVEKKLQDKIRGVDLKGCVDWEVGYIHRVIHLGRLDIIFLERNIFKRISRGYRQKPDK